MNELVKWKEYARDLGGAFPSTTKELYACQRVRPISSYSSVSRLGYASTY